MRHLTAPHRDDSQAADPARGDVRPHASTYRAPAHAVPRPARTGATPLRRPAARPNLGTVRPVHRRTCGPCAIPGTPHLSTRVGLSVMDGRLPHCSPQAGFRTRIRPSQRLDVSKVTAFRCDPHGPRPASAARPRGRRPLNCRQSGCPCRSARLATGQAEIVV
jgi:hypothetical protein